QRHGSRAGGGSCAGHHRCGSHSERLLVSRRYGHGYGRSLALRRYGHGYGYGRRDGHGRNGHGHGELVAANRAAEFGSGGFSLLQYLPSLRGCGILVREYRTPEGVCRMSLEPQKFYIGVVDFFSILMPGALLTYLSKDWAASRSEEHTS